MVRGTAYKMAGPPERRVVHSAPLDFNVNDPAMNALDCAYNNLKTRYNELSRRNSDLLRQVKRGSVDSCTVADSPYSAANDPSEILNDSSIVMRQRNLELEIQNEQLLKGNKMLNSQLKAMTAEKEKLEKEVHDLREQNASTNGPVDSQLIRGFQQLLLVVKNQRKEIDQLQTLADRQKQALQKLAPSLMQKDSPADDLSIPTQCTDFDADNLYLLPRDSKETSLPSIQSLNPLPSNGPSVHGHTAPLTADSTLAKHQEAFRSHTAPIFNNTVERPTTPRHLNFDRNSNVTDGVASSIPSRDVNLFAESQSLASSVLPYKHIAPENLTSNLCRRKEDFFTPRDQAEGAAGGSPQICPVCYNDFTPSLSVTEFEAHVNECLPSEDHNIQVSVRECPMCKEKFSDSITDEELHEHVESHFQADFSIINSPSV